MSAKTHTCDCSGAPVEVGNDTASRYEHNTLPCHHRAVLIQTGAPAHLIASWTEGTPEWEARIALIEVERAALARDMQAYLVSAVAK